MLIEFTVSNFKCIKEAATLSLEASRDDTLGANVCTTEETVGHQLLTSAVIYGANASGKSTLLEALAFMSRYARSSASDRSGVPPVPFLFDAQTASKPTVVEAKFSVEGKVYVYGFSVTKDRVLAEHLYGVRDRKRLLFRRSVSGDGKSTFKFGSSWKGQAKRIGQMTRKDALFLSVASSFAHPLADKLLRWLGTQIARVHPSPVGGGEEMFTMRTSKEDATVQQQVTSILRRADLQIEGFDVYERQPSDDPAMHKALKALEIEFGEPRLGATTLHKGRDASDEPTLMSLKMELESSGTQKLFALAGPLIHVLDNGSVLVADELGRSLHPLLTRAVVEMFHNPEINKNGAQLLFTTHDTSLLAGDLFRRDQVWITEKNAEGATKLASLWDYRARKDENVMRSYLSGRYGGVPFVDGLAQAREPSVE